MCFHTPTELSPEAPITAGNETRQSPRVDHHTKRVERAVERDNTVIGGRRAEQKEALRLQVASRWHVNHTCSTFKVSSTFPTKISIASVRLVLYLRYLGLENSPFQVLVV